MQQQVLAVAGVRWPYPRASRFVASNLNNSIGHTTVSAMSPVLQTVIGAIAAIAGGFLAAWWQTSRADKIARTIRRAERREEGLLVLNVKVTDVHAAIDRIYQAAEAGQAHTALPPIRLTTVRGSATSTWSREEIYGDEGR